jgi:hypothetical protein
VGDGSKVKVGGNAIMRCDRDIFLLEKNIQHLQVISICTLNLIDIAHDTSLRLDKGVDLGLKGNLARRWDHFLAKL